MKSSFKTALILSAIGVPALFGVRDASAKDKSSVTAAPAAGFAPYVGVWAPAEAACRGGGRDVFRITAKGEEGQEWQCEIKHASEEAGEWSMRMACASEGKDYNERARWRIDGAGNLHQTIGRKAKAYVRCRDGAAAVALAKTKPLPAEVQSAINDDIKGCAEKVTYRRGFLTRRDINGDGIEDFILDYGRFSCGDNSTLYCGSAGCLMTVFTSLPNGKFVKTLDGNVQSIDFKIVRGRPAMVLELHGSSCGKIGSEPCGATLYWNGETFSPAH